MEKGQIISLGSINKDIQVRAERWPEPGETLMVTDLLTLGGGKAANRSYLTCKLGAPSLLVARVGDDDEAEEALRSLKKVGVNLDHVKRLPGQRTGLSMIAVRPDGNKTILLAANANENWEEEGADAVGKVILEAPEGSVLALDLEISDPVIQKALEAAKERKFKIIMDPSPTSKFQDTYFKIADILTPNQSEAESLVGFEIESIEDGFSACEAIIEKGARRSLVKLGNNGYVFMAKGKKIHLPALEAKVMDTTGAGDAFAGAFAFAIWEGQKIPDAVRFAAAASTLAVEGYGSQPAYPDRKAIEKKLKEYEG
ncbi:ribokinase [soil metagenome]